MCAVFTEPSLGPLNNVGRFAPASTNDTSGRFARVSANIARKPLSRTTSFHKECSHFSGLTTCASAASNERPQGARRESAARAC